MLKTDLPVDVAVADSLEEIFRMQQEYKQMMDMSRFPKRIQERISSLCTAIIHEAVELQGLTDWKWWKRPGRFDRAKAREELIDIWHFVVDASMELGLTPTSLLREYRRKNLVNRRRQREGY